MIKAKASNFKEMTVMSVLESLSMYWPALMFALIIVGGGVVFFKSFYNDYDKNPIVVGRRNCDGIILLGISLALAAPLVTGALMHGLNTKTIVVSVVVDFAIVFGIYRWLKYWSDDAINRRLQSLHDQIDYDAGRRNQGLRSHL